MDNEKIVEIESYIAQITHDMKKLSIVDLDLVDDVSDLEKVVSDLKNQFLKKVEFYFCLPTSSSLDLDKAREVDGNDDGSSS